MKYVINAESLFHTYRYTRNRQWLNCENVTDFSNNDYTTEDPLNIIELQVTDLQVRIDDEDFVVQPEMGYDMNENQLSYQIYGFRRVYPEPPNENQLMEVLLNGDDTVRNTLVLQTDGRFYLLQPEFISGALNPEFVLQFTSFPRNGGFIGNEINNDELRVYVQNLFKTAIHYWIQHLRQKTLHNHVSCDLLDIDPIPNIIDLFGELNELSDNWVPDYQ